MSKTKRSLGLAAGLGICLLTGLGWAAQNRVLLKDKDSTVTITNYKGFLFKRLPNGQTRATATGTPLRAEWTRQGMTMNTQRFEGVIKQGSQGLDLITATLIGDLFVRIERPSSIAGAQTKQELILESESGTYTAATNLFTLTGGVQVRQKDDPAHQSAFMSGSGAKVTLYPVPVPKGSSSPIKSATVSGPVVLKLNSRQTIEGKPQDTVVNGRSNNLIYDADNRSYTLSGNVEVSGNNPVLFGEITGSRVIIRMDTNGDVDEIEVIGEPSTADIVKKNPVGGKGRSNL